MIKYNQVRAFQLLGRGKKNLLLPSLRLIKKRVKSYGNYLPLWLDDYMQKFYRRPDVELLGGAIIKDTTFSIIDFIPSSA